MTTLVTEAVLTESIMSALLYVPGGWLAYHTHNSFRSEPGFPDIVAQETKAPYRNIYLELKTEGKGLDKGKWSKHKGAGRRWLTGQDEWAKYLTASPNAEYYHIWPSDLVWLYQYFIDPDAPRNFQGERVAKTPAERKSEARNQRAGGPGNEGQR